MKSIAKLTASYIGGEGYSLDYEPEQNNIVPLMKGINGMENCIFNDNDNSTIGYYKDLKAGLKKTIEDYIKDENWEEVKDMADLLLDLNAWAGNESLLVLSDNNGMGYTIKEYKKGE